MKSGIFYFSGAGNSKAVAQEISSNLSYDVCLPINEVQDSDLDDLSVVGLVFPVYYFAPPTAMLSFIKETLQKKQRDLSYLFVILTNGGMSFFAPSITEMLLQEAGYLPSYCETVKMVDTFAPLTQIPSKEKQDSISKSAHDKVMTIIEDIKEQKIQVKTRWPLSHTALFVFKSIADWRYQYDKKFIVDERCNGCGVCVEKCPVNNITLEGGKIEYLHHCEQCFACYHHCPQHAITLKPKPLRGYTYYTGPQYFTNRN
jgi:ferredoxin